MWISNKRLIALSIRCGAFVIALLIAAPMRAADRSGPIAEWNFDEGQMDVAHDSSGMGRHAKIVGASWVDHGDGFAVGLDGVDDCVDCTRGKPLTQLDTE